MEMELNHKSDVVLGLLHTHKKPSVNNVGVATACVCVRACVRTAVSGCDEGTHPGFAAGIVLELLASDVYGCGWVLQCSNLYKLLINLT